jgi:transposase
MDTRHDEHERIRQLTEENRQLAAQLQQQAARIQELEAELKRLKQLLEGKAESKAAKKPVFKENYSLDRNTRSKQKRRGKAATGRRPKEQKRQIIASEQDVYPVGVGPKACVLHREQFAWRLINGRAVYVCYRIYDLPGSKQLPLPPGLRTSRSEYGIEIILILAFLHYWVGLSLDHTCTVMQFFTKLELPKSQADSLLKQLASDWDEQYDTIAELIALQMIVYIDETGWKVGTKSCYTWVFSTALHVLFRCGVSRAKTEATMVLGN